MFTVYGFMKNELHLEGEELVAYAIIHQFTLWSGAFNENFELIADWLDCDTGHVIDVINDLVVEHQIVTAHPINGHVMLVAEVTKDNR